MLSVKVQPYLEQYVEEDYVLSEEGTRVVYNANANLPEAYFEHLEFPVSEFWFKYFSRRIHLLPPENFGVALDVCAGTGTVCLNIMKHKLFETCYAIDISETAVRTIQKRIRSLGITGVEAVCDNIMCTRFDNNMFDCIIGNSFLHHLPDNIGFLQEMYRILKPGGTICFTGEPSIAAPRLEGFILGSLLAIVRQIGLRSHRHARPVLTDIWLYEYGPLTSVLKKIGYDSVKVVPFGFLVPLFNGPCAMVYKKATGKSMQPDMWWRVLGGMDRWFFSWLPKNSLSYFVIAGRKPY